MLIKRPASMKRGSGAPARRRRLNLVLIKRWIVFFAGLITAFCSGITGLGAQIAMAPMLVWMLGFNAEKAQASAMRFAFVTAVAAVVGALYAHAAPPYFLSRGLALFVGAVAGALMVTPLAKRFQTRRFLQFSLTFGIGVGLLIAMRTARLGIYDTIAIASWRSTLQLSGLGLIVGALTQLMRLPGGLLMVPALYYFGSFAPSEAISLSLLVIALASLLPTWSYQHRGMTDRSYGAAIVVAGVIGGLLGGRVLPPDHGALHYGHRQLIIVSAVIAMFLCARELSRLNSVDISPTDVEPT